MKTDRLIAILSVLMQKQKVTTGYLAEKFEVSRRTIMRDIEVLNNAGIPIISEQGYNGGISVIENAAFAKIFKKHFYMAYSLYSNIEDEVLAEFTPTLIYCWGYKLNKPYMEYWDFINESYHLEYK